MKNCSVCCGQNANLFPFFFFYRMVDVSKEAQEEAKKQFEALGGEKAFYGKQMDKNEEKNPNQVAGGLKA